MKRPSEGANREFIERRDEVKYISIDSAGGHTRTCSDYSGAERRSINASRDHDEQYRIYRREIVHTLVAIVEHDHVEKVSGSGITTPLGSGSIKLNQE